MTPNTARKAGPPPDVPTLPPGYPGDLVVVMGPLNLGPEAVVRGDVVVVGGRLNRTPGAQVLGDLNEVGMGRGVGNRDRRSGGAFGWLWSGVSGLAATVARIILMVLAALIVLAVARAAVERIAARTIAAPARAGLTGLAAELLFVPLLAVTVTVLAVSIVGIPLCSCRLPSLWSCAEPSSGIPGWRIGWGA